MIHGKTVLGLVMARGGSKGIPRKNLRLVGGKPMLAWTINAAQDSSFIDRTILSSDDPEIITLARELGCEVPFVRPARLAADDTSAMDVVRHAVSALKTAYDYLVLLQPTSPLRTGIHIDECLTLCYERAAPAAVSVVEAATNPYWMYSVEQDLRLTALMGPKQRPTRRQELPSYYALNGAIFVARTAWLLKNNDFVGPESVAYIMPPESSVDIDTERDLWLANALIHGNGAFAPSGTGSC
jgi:CMP-N,N'-diacetyllegionaminic acid synthase